MDDEAELKTKLEKANKDIKRIEGAEGGDPGDLERAKYEKRKLQAQLLELQGHVGVCPPPRGPAEKASFQPRVEIGVQTGLAHSFGGGSLTGVDSFGGIFRVDLRPLQGVGSQFAIGGQITLFPFPAWQFPVNGGALSAQPFLRTGISGFVGDGVTSNVVGVNAVPFGTGDVIQRSNWGVPILGGLRVSVSSPQFDGGGTSIGLEVAGGVQITNRTATLSLVEGGAGFTPGAFASVSETTIDPMFSVGVPVGFQWNAQPIVLTPSVNVVFPQGFSLGAPSWHFPSETYRVRTSSSAEVQFVINAAVPFDLLTP
jgi:hypothetical protein